MVSSSEDCELSEGTGSDSENVGSDDENSWDCNGTKHNYSHAGGRRDLEKSLKDTKDLLRNRKRKREHGVDERDSDQQLDDRFFYRNPKYQRRSTLLPEEIIDKIRRFVVVSHKQDMLRELLFWQENGACHQNYSVNLCSYGHSYSVSDLHNKNVLKKPGLVRVLTPLHFWAKNVWITAVFRWRHVQEDNGISKRKISTDAQLRGWLKHKNLAGLWVGPEEIFRKISTLSKWKFERWQEYLEYG